MHDFRVRVAPIRQWLIHLKRYHPGYRDIDIDDDALQQLEELSRDNDGSIIEHFVSKTDPVPDDAADGADDGEDVLAVVVAVPDLLPNNQEIDEIRRGINGRTRGAPLAQLHSATPTLTMPPFRSTPLSEFNNTLPLLSLTFPTLFLRGEADFVAPRIRAIKYKEYV